MATLQGATKQDIQFLLELFPASALKRNWDYFRGTKPEMCEQIAAEGDLTKIAAFVANNFARCRQHVYVLARRQDDGASPTEAFPDSDGLGTDPYGREVHLATLRYKVLLGDPFEEAEVEMLWPVRVANHANTTLVSFIVMERDIKVMFPGRPVITSRRRVEESDIVAALHAFGFAGVDLNRGVKALWADDYMDAIRAQYKKARSVSSEKMDKDRGLKETDPDLYKSMILRPLFDMVYRVAASAGNAVEVFQINPTTGSLRIIRYTEGDGDSDEIIHAILEKNL